MYSPDLLTNMIPAEDYVVILEGTPFSVPAGRFFHLTGFGTQDPLASGQLTNDPKVTVKTPGGSPVASIGQRLFWRESVGSNVKESLPYVISVPPGFVAPPGMTIEVENVTTSPGTNPPAICWGFLQDAAQ